MHGDGVGTNESLSFSKAPIASGETFPPLGFPLLHEQCSTLHDCVSALRDLIFKHFSFRNLVSIKITTRLLQYCLLRSSYVVNLFELRLNRVWR